MKEDATELFKITGPRVFGCTLKSPPIWRQIAWICAAILTCVTGLKLIPVCEQRGYFRWAEELPVQLMALVFLVLLLCLVFAVVFLAKRHTEKFRRPAYVPLLSGYTGPRNARSVGLLVESLKTLPEHQVRRIRLLQTHSVVPGVLLCPIAGMLITAASAAAAFHRFAPGTNPDNWLTVGGMICTIPISMYLYLLTYTRILMRRKGRERAMRFMFTSAVHGEAGLIDRLGIEVLGLSSALRAAKHFWDY